MKSRKIIMTCFATFTVFLISIIVLNTKKNIYDVNMPIRNYDFSDYKVEDEYINHLKKDIYPIKIRSFIDNDFIQTNLLSEDDTGKEIAEGPHLGFTGHNPWIGAPDSYTYSCGHQYSYILSMRQQNTRIYFYKPSIPEADLTPEAIERIND